MRRLRLGVVLARAMAAPVKAEDLLETSVAELGPRCDRHCAAPLRLLMLGGLRTVAVVLALGTGTAGSCEVVDFLTVPLAKGGLFKVAIETAYPGVKVENAEVAFPDEKRLPLGDIREVEPDQRLKTATIAEQFLFRYPLGFDLEPRRTAWADPGRLRNSAFFRALYPGGKTEIRQSLETMRYPGLRVKPKFAVTTRHCVHVQLKAALDEIAEHGSRMDRFFENPGGSFNWRRISGTKRLSAHSFGIAVDINTQLGQYWRWSGAEPGKVRRYRNKIPEALVTAFERRGFIWGGKWHHYDGMHFEYRPELILFSRLTGGG